jgi:putative endopeptidase
VEPDLLAGDFDQGDDFFAYVNEEWLAGMAGCRPASARIQPLWRVQSAARKSTTDVKTLIGELIDELVARDRATFSANERRNVDMHNAFLGTDAINAAGFAPAQPYIDALSACLDH